MNQKELFDLLKRRSAIDIEIAKKNAELKELVMQMVQINKELDEYRIQQSKETK